MKQKNLIALGAVTVVVVVLAVVAGKRSGASAAPATAASGPLLAGLTQRINDVAVLEVTQGGETVTIEKSGADWAIRSASGYPAKFETVKKALVALADLELAEAKTSDPKRYAELGVQDPLQDPPEDPPKDPAQDPLQDPYQDPTEEDGAPKLVVLKDAGGTVIESVVIGNAKPGRSPELYARKTDEARAWKVKGRVDLKTDAKSWMDSQVANVASDRTKEVTVVHPDGERLRVYKADKSDTNFVVENVPADRELLSPSIANSLASVLSYLALDDVRPVAEVDFAAAPVSTAELRTWDGLVVVARVAEYEGLKWVTFEARYEAPPTPPVEDAGAAEDAQALEGSEDGAEGDESAVEAKPAQEHDAAAIQAEALELHADLSPWAFRFPSYKQSNFEKRLADLLRQPTPPPAPEAVHEALPEDGEVLQDGESGIEGDSEAAHDESPEDPHDHDDHSEDGPKSDG